MIIGLSIGLAVLAYFVGNLDFAYIMVKAVRHEDVRNYGSGNAGTTNVLRTMGLKYAIPVFILDALKGTLCILLARYLIGAFGLSEWMMTVTGIAVICGHNWPVCLGFRGGKGTATSIGVFLAYDPLVAGICIAFGLLILAIFKMVSLTSISGLTSLPIVILLVRGLVWTPELALGIFLCCSSVFQHRSNIKRILAGTESKIGQKVDMGGKK